MIGCGWRLMNAPMQYSVISDRCLDTTGVPSTVMLWMENSPQETNSRPMHSIRCALADMWWRHRLISGERMTTIR